MIDSYVIRNPGVVKYVHLHLQDPNVKPELVACGMRDKLSRMLGLTGYFTLSENEDLVAVGVAPIDYAVKRIWVGEDCAGGIAKKGSNASC